MRVTQNRGGGGEHFSPCSIWLKIGWPAVSNRYLQINQIRTKQGDESNRIEIHMWKEEMCSMVGGGGGGGPNAPPVFLKGS